MKKGLLFVILLFLGLFLHAQSIKSVKGKNEKFTVQTIGTISSENGTVSITFSTPIKDEYAITITPYADVIIYISEKSDNGFTLKSNSKKFKCDYVVITKQVREALPDKDDN